MTQTRLRRRQFLIQHGLGLVQRVRQHDIRAEPEIHFFHVGGGDGGVGVEGIIELEVGREVGGWGGLIRP